MIIDPREIKYSFNRRRKDIQPPLRRGEISSQVERIVYPPMMEQWVGTYRVVATTWVSENHNRDRCETNFHFDVLNRAIHRTVYGRIGDELDDIMLECAMDEDAKRRIHQLIKRMRGE